MSTENPRRDDRARRIRELVRSEEECVLARFPFLARRNAVGAAFFLLAAGGMAALGGLYWAGWIPWYLCLFGNAFLASILHEIEHDLIHFLYFKNRPRLHDAMMLGVWVLRGNVVHGWYRRGLHVHHHRASGTESDVEERLLGLGMPWGLKRLAATVDGTLAFLVSGRRLAREVPGFEKRDLARAAMPVYPVFVLVLAVFLASHGLRLLVPGYEPSAVLVAIHPAIDLLAVAWVFPNYLRQASLQLVSSNVHYYEDVSSIDEETQVLRPVWLWPLQLFCFNFGSTHLLHHYVVEQPFYLRQLVAWRVLPRLAELGVRVNDVATFRRANRFSAKTTLRSM